MVFETKYSWGRKRVESKSELEGDFEARIPWLTPSVPKSAPFVHPRPRGHLRADGRDFTLRPAQSYVLSTIFSALKPSLCCRGGFIRKNPSRTMQAAVGVRRLVA